RSERCGPSSRHRISARWSASASHSFSSTKGYVERSDSTVQAMKEVVYGKWREYDPEDAVRFYALRLHEVGLIKSSPQKIIAQGTDWRFLNELKKELEE